MRTVRGRDRKRLGVRDRTVSRERRSVRWKRVVKRNSRSGETVRQRARGEGSGYPRWRTNERSESRPHPAADQDKGPVMVEKQAREISYPDGSSEGLLVSPVGTNLYRLEESSLLGEADFGDVIEAEPTQEGGLLFKRVAVPSGMTTVNCILTPEQMQAPGLQPLLDRIMSLGGNWERALDGLLMIHLPKSVDLNIEAEVKALSASSI